MAALTTDRKYKIRAGGSNRVETYKIAAATTIFNGALVAFNAAGYIVPASDTAALTVVGIAQSRVVNTGAAGDKEVTVMTSMRTNLNNAGGAITIAALGKPVYAADDNSVTTAAVATNDLLVGVCDCIDSDGVWVFIDLAINATA